MLNHRVIPVLLLSSGGLVKTTRFADPRYVGDPLNAVKIFNEKEVDELVLLDIDATRTVREPDYAVIEEIASEAFIPLTYGGGIRTVAQAARVFALGVEKVAVRAAGMQRVELLGELAAEFGSSSVVASVDVAKGRFGKTRLQDSARTPAASVDWRDWLVQVQAAGAGEVLLQVVDRDGAMAGLDLAMVREAAAVLTVPLVAASGVGSLADIRAAVEAGADGVAAGAFFVFHGRHRAVLISYPPYESLRLLLDDLR